MFLNKSKAIFLSFLLLAGFVFTVSAQNTATPTQRLQIIRQQLDQMRRSVDSAISVLKDDNEGDKSKKDDKSKLETPLGRFRGLDKEISSLSSEVNTLRGKVDRSEKYENTEIEGLEEAYAGLKTRVDAALLETAIARANPTSDVGTPREKKKKKKFLWIFGGGGNDEYEELIGSITPGRDKELFIVATREVRKNNYEVGRLAFPDDYHDLSRFAVSADGKIGGCRFILSRRLDQFTDSIGRGL